MATVEGEAAPGEFQDWEVLVNSDSELVNSPDLVDDDNTRNFEEIEADSEGVIRLDYFSLENDNRYAKSPAAAAAAAVVDASEEDSVESDNPTWIDPGSDSRYQRRNSGELWSDSGSDRSDERKFGDVDVKNELGVADYGKIQVGSEGIGEIEANFAGEGKFEGKSEVSFEDRLGESQGKENDLAKFWSDSGGEGSIFGDAGNVDCGGSGISGELGDGDVSEEGNSSIVATEDKGPRGEEEKRKVVWWKVPFEVLKFCVFRASPVWSFSMAAALVGFVILGRRLYKMKRKTQSLHLKVTMDDKKVSQVMSRAARLNEAFSVVRRVPIVRPLLPAAGLNPWPVVSLR